MKHMRTSIIYLFSTTYTIWVFYLAVMNLARAKRERLSLQLWISSVERQIQALQQQ